MSKTKERLSPFVRATVTDERGLTLATRAGVRLEDHFGDEQYLTIDADEAEALYEVLRDHYGDES